MAIDNKINGKTPEEIKRGLECCTVGGGCDVCAYDDVSGMMCLVQLKMDALAYIQQLENHFRYLTKKVEQFERERDAAVEAPLKWISVKDNPPDGTKNVIAYGMYGGMLIGHVLPMSNGKEYYCETPEDNIYHVTHWMLLPAPPKEET